MCYHWIGRSDFDPLGLCSDLYLSEDGFLRYYRSDISKHIIASSLPSLIATGGCSETFIPTGGSYYLSVNTATPVCLSSSLALWFNGSGFIISSVIWGGNSSTDTWWYRSGNSFLGTFTKQGVATADAVVAVATQLEWESSSFNGAYSGMNGASGTKYFGWRTLAVSGISDALIEQTSKYNSKPLFKGGAWVLWHNESNYILSSAAGTANPLTGYWLGAANVVNGAYALVYTGDSSSRPVPDTYTVSTSNYTANPGITSELYICEISHILRGN